MKRITLIAFAALILTGCQDRVIWDDKGKIEKATENREVWDSNGQMETDEREVWVNKDGEKVVE